MRGTVTLVAAAFFCLGLWQHDWRIILGAVVLEIIGLLAAEERDAMVDYHRNRSARRARREHLDRLWADDDLSDSA